MGTESRQRFKITPPSLSTSALIDHILLLGMQSSDPQTGRLIFPPELQLAILKASIPAASFSSYRLRHQIIHRLAAVSQSWSIWACEEFYRDVVLSNHIHAQWFCQILDRHPSRWGVIGMRLGGVGNSFIPAERFKLQELLLSCSSSLRELRLLMVSRLSLRDLLPVASSESHLPDPTPCSGR